MGSTSRRCGIDKWINCFRSLYGAIRFEVNKFKVHCFKNLVASVAARECFSGFVVRFFNFKVPPVFSDEYLEGNICRVQ